jgi:hypothetical protein
MAEYKYIMFQVESDDMSFKIPIIFPGALAHDDVARALQPMMEQTFQSVGPVSIPTAGMVSALQVVGTTGESTTLLKKSDPGDEVLINEYPYMNGNNTGMPVWHLIALKFVESLMERLRNL